jgi:uncharacterized metal-binding protein YceD (DUF177 family)
LLPRNEFSRTLVVDPWPEAGIEVDVSAGPEERQALARRFDLVEVRSLRGRGRLERCEQPAELVFSGWLTAEVVQSCVASLEPVAATLRQRVERRYRLGGRPGAGGDRWQPEGVLDLDADADEVEPLSGREIDIGEALAEELGLALDPYPRAVGTEAIEAEAMGPYVSLGRAEPDHPFAALRQLQDKHPR